MLSLYCDRDVVLLCCRREVLSLCYERVVFLQARMLFLRWGHDVDNGREVLALGYWRGCGGYVWSRSAIVVLLLRGRHKVLSLPMLHVWAWCAVTTLYVDAKWYRYDCWGRMLSQRIPGEVTKIACGWPTPLGRSAILASAATRCLSLLREVTVW